MAYDIEINRVPLHLGMGKLIVAPAFRSQLSMNIFITRMIFTFPIGVLYG